VGNYHLSHAYGGVCLHRMDNESGGVTIPLDYGYMSRRELYNAMRAFIEGFEAARHWQQGMLESGEQGMLESGEQGMLESGEQGMLSLLGLKPSARGDAS
jgi:hypothetical protein